VRAQPHEGEGNSLGPVLPVGVVSLTGCGCWDVLLPVSQHLPPSPGRKGANPHRSGSETFM